MVVIRPPWQVQQQVDQLRDELRRRVSVVDASGRAIGPDY